MKLVSFAIAFLLPILIVASCLSNSLAQKCSTDKDCESPCEGEGLGFCKSGECKCMAPKIPAKVVSNCVAQECSSEKDSESKCESVGSSFYESGRLPSKVVAKVISNSMAQECSSEKDCESKCKSEGLGICESRRCKCLPTKIAVKAVTDMETQCKIDVDCIELCGQRCEVHKCKFGICDCECTSA